MAENSRRKATIQRVINLKFNQKYFGKKIWLMTNISNI